MKSKFKEFGVVKGSKKKPLRLSSIVERRAKEISLAFALGIGVALGCGSSKDEGQNSTAANTSPTEVTSPVGAQPPAETTSPTYSKPSSGETLPPLVVKCPDGSVVEFSSTPTEVVVSCPQQEQTTAEESSSSTSDTTASTSQPIDLGPVIYSENVLLGNNLNVPDSNFFPALAVTFVSYDLDSNKVRLELYHAPPSSLDGTIQPPKNLFEEQSIYRDVKVGKPYALDLYYRDNNIYSLETKRYFVVRKIVLPSTTNAVAGYSGPYDAYIIVDYLENPPYIEDMLEFHSDNVEMGFGYPSQVYFEHTRSGKKGIVSLRGFTEDGRISWYSLDAETLSVNWLLSSLVGEKVCPYFIDGEDCIEIEELHSNTFNLPLSALLRFYPWRRGYYAYRGKDYTTSFSEFLKKAPVSEHVWGATTQLADAYVWLHSNVGPLSTFAQSITFPTPLSFPAASTMATRITLPLLGRDLPVMATDFSTPGNERVTVMTEEVYHLFTKTIFDSSDPLNDPEACILFSPFDVIVCFRGQAYTYSGPTGAFNFRVYDPQTLQLIGGGNIFPGELGKIIARKDETSQDGGVATKYYQIFGKLWSVKAINPTYGRYQAEISLGAHVLDLANGQEVDRLKLPGGLSYAVPMTFGVNYNMPSTTSVELKRLWFALERWRLH